MFESNWEYVTTMIKLGTYCLIKLSTSCIKWFKMEVMVWNQWQKLSMIIIPTFDNNNLSSFLFLLSCLSFSSSLLAYLLHPYMPTWGCIRALFHYLLVSNLCSCFRCFVTFLFLACTPITLALAYFEFALPYEFDVLDKLNFN